MFPGPAQATVYEAFRDTALRVPGQAFLRILPETAQAYGVPAGDWSYAQTLEEAERLRGCYEQAGYGPGQRIGLLLENRPAFFVHWLALNALGVAVVPLGADLRAAELAYLTEHSELCLVLALAQREGDLRAAAQLAGRDIRVVLPSHQGPFPKAPPSHSVAWGLDAECALLYTSGTTGRPKGCVLTNRYFLLAGEWYSRLGGLCTIEPDRDVLITPLPMHHVNAMAFSTMVMMMNGGCIVPLDRFHPKTWWESVRTSQASVIHYLGVMPSLLMSAPATGDDSTHRVRFGFGAGVDKGLHAPFEARFGFPLVEAWAMTETGAGAAIIAHREPRHVGTACFGRASQDVEFKLVDEAGQEVAAGTPGELLVRAAGPDPRSGFFREYLKDAQATALAWEGGWFHTGDVVRADAAGNLYFVDRRKNLIRRSGENISAAEVESVLRQHAGVKDVAVCATPDSVRGDEVMACVVLKDAAHGKEDLARELVNGCLDQLAYYKTPGWVAFVGQLPLTASQKVQRAELKKIAEQLPGKPGVYDTRAMKTRGR
ncbi:MAG: AMP-binding protein [Burkholderiales bacterium]